MSDSAKRGLSIWGVALIGGVAAGLVAIALDIAGVETLGREAASVIRAVSIGMAIGLAVFFGRGQAGK